MSWKGSGTVLLIEDEPAVREFAATVLERAGFRVMQARDGAEGIALYERNARDLVLSLLDLNLPKVRGDQVFRAIRRIDRDAPVILCSGYDEELPGDANETGAAPVYLSKPYRTAELLERVREALAGR